MKIFGAWYESEAGGVNEVMRVGDAVHRPGGTHTPAVHALLRHPRSQGFTGCPDVLDWDPRSVVETLSFLTGDAGEYPLTPAFRTDRALVSAAQLLRRLHDATVGFDHDRFTTWMLPTRQPIEVVCHGDFAPYNCVIVDGEVVGVFDFDTAHPAPRVWDVAYAAYRWAPHAAPGKSGRLRGDVEQQARRLRLFCDGYGFDDRRAVVDAAIERLDALVGYMRVQARAGDRAFARHIDDGHDVMYEGDVEYVRVDADRLAGRT